MRVVRQNNCAVATQGDIAEESGPEAIDQPP